MSSAPRRCALALLALLGAAPGAEPVQPLLMPMAQLLKQLDRGQEWLMLPLADYQQLVAAGRAPRPDAARIPGGAWIETARVTGTLRDDRTLRLRAELAVVSAAPGAGRCRLFMRSPDVLGAATLGGAPALVMPHGDGGVDLLLPGPGRHAAVVAWTVALDAAADGSWSGSLPLPLGAGLEVALDSADPGELLGAGLAPLDARHWALVRPAGGELALSWHPGRQEGDTTAAWGVEQTVQVALPDDPAAPRSWRWTAKPGVLRGRLPASLTVRLPAGWTATGTGGGVLESTPVDGGMLLRIAPAVEELVLDGVAAADAVVALPAIDGAIWQGGRIALENASRSDWTLPPRWQVLGAAHEPMDAAEQASASLRAFAVPGPDAGMRLSSPLAADSASTVIATTVAVGAERWRMDARLVVQAGGEDRFSLPLRLPAGWRALSATCSAAARIAGADADGALSDTPADGVLRIDLPNGLRRAGPVTIAIALERDAASGPQAIVPPTPEGGGRVRHQVVIAGAPSLDLQVVGNGWQQAADVALPASSAAKAVRTVLAAVGAAPALTITSSPKAAVCEAEAVAWLLPIDGQEAAPVWCRLDLHLTVSDGELDALELDLPLVADSIQLADPALALVHDGPRTLLRAGRPWRGERLVRIEGRLAAAAGPRIGFPRVGVRRIDGGAVPTVLHAALQAPEKLDLRLEPGGAAQPEDEDDLPRWSRAIPGEPVAGVWRIGAGEAGGFALVSRALADPPPGFVHHLEIRTQVAAGRALSLLRFRLAAPGLAALPLQLPVGSTLVAATLDGRAAAVRRSAGDAVIPLPGRTQIDVALLIDAPRATDARIDLRLPGLGGLPVTGLTWLMAADAASRLVPTSGPDALRMSPVGGLPAARPWFAAWRDADGRVDGAVPTPVAAPVAAEDPRRLAPPVPTVVPLGEPTLTLTGQLWQGERAGGGVRIAMTAQPLADLRLADRLGAALAVLLGVWLAWRLRPSASLALALASLSAAAALHASGCAVGPLLALGEWLGPVLAAAVAIRAVAACRPISGRTLEAAP